jgi:hypothetical protein
MATAATHVDDGAARYERAAAWPPPSSSSPPEANSSLRGLVQAGGHTYGRDVVPIGDLSKR